MKQILLITALCAVACLLSCRTHKTVTATDRDSAMSYVDTTVTTADTFGLRQTDTDTTRTAATYESDGLIEFVDGGGKVTFDSTGAITFDGVMMIRGHHGGAFTLDRGISRQAEETAAHREQLNGVASDTTSHENRAEEKAPARKWYDTILARLGLGVCIAALIWLLFLYLKRKL